MKYEEAIGFLRNTVKLAETQEKLGVVVVNEDTRKSMDSITVVCNRAEVNTIVNNIKIKH